MSPDNTLNPDHRLFNWKRGNLLNSSEICKWKHFRTVTCVLCLQSLNQVHSNLG